MADQVVIHIGADDSGFESTLRSVETKISAAAALTASQGTASASRVTQALNTACAAAETLASRIAALSQTVTLSVTVDAASQDLYSEGARLASQLQSGLSSKNAAIRASGSAAGEGFRKGLESRRSAILSTARSIANAVSSAISSALQIHSPSKVTEQLGRFAAEGFDNGLNEGLRSAVDRAERTAAGISLTVASADTGRSAVQAQSVSSWPEMVVEMDGATVGRLVEKHVSREQAARCGRLRKSGVI